MDFSNINSNHINEDSVFFLFGNFRRSFEIFCDFIVENIRKKFETIEINSHYCSLQECSKIIQNRCDLFGNTLNIFCIREVEDQHLDKLTPLFQESNCVFVLEAGDFRKAKKITEFFRENRKMYAIPSFNNDITLTSLCKLLLPSGIQNVVYRKIVELINSTDEPLISFFQKINLLIDETEKSSKNIDISKLLQEYIVYKTSFIQKMDFIPLLKYLQKSTVKEKILEKKVPFNDQDLLRENMLGKLIKEEINYKFGIPLPKCVLK